MVARKAGVKAPGWPFDEIANRNGEESLSYSSAQGGFSGGGLSP